MSRPLTAALPWLLAGLAGCAALNGAPVTQRHTTHGPVLGVDDSAATGTYHWKGIPFAAPPVAERETN